MSENARLDVNPPAAIDDDAELWDQSGFMLRSDTDDPLTNSKFVKKKVYKILKKLNHTRIYNFFFYFSKKKNRWGAQNWCRPSCIPISIILILIVLVVLLPLLDHADKHAPNSSLFGNDSDGTCMDSCRISLVESIPIGLNYSKDAVIHTSTYLTWMDLVASAERSIEIASLYWTMKRQDVYPDDSAKEVKTSIRRDKREWR